MLADIIRQSLFFQISFWNLSLSWHCCCWCCWPLTSHYCHLAWSKFGEAKGLLPSAWSNWCVFSIRSTCQSDWSWIHLTAKLFRPYDIWPMSFVSWWCSSLLLGSQNPFTRITSLRRLKMIPIAMKYIPLLELKKRYLSPLMSMFCDPLQVHWIILSVHLGFFA